MSAERRSDKASVAAARRLAKKLGVDRSQVTRGGGIRFDSYDDFKKSLGRSGVDLRGASAPHMLQAITVKTTGTRDASGSRLSEVIIGVYGEAAARGQGHNAGNPKTGLPQRRWFGASRDDAKKFSEDVMASIRARNS